MSGSGEVHSPLLPPPVHLTEAFYYAIDPDHGPLLKSVSLSHRDSTSLLSPQNHDQSIPEHSHYPQGSSCGVEVQHEPSLVVWDVGGVVVRRRGHGGY